MVKAIRCDAMDRLIGKNSVDVKLARKDRVQPIASMTSAIKIREDIVPVDPHQLLNRILCIMQHSQDLEHFFAYELSSQPTSLFSDYMLRKNQKAKLTKAIMDLSSCGSSNLPGNCKFVVDGGYLLHRVVWPRICTFENLYKIYLDYLKMNF